MPFRLRDIQRRKAAQSCKAEDPALLTESVSIYQDLRNDLAILKSFDGKSRKIEYKKERYGHYLPWVLGLIAGDQGQEDKVLEYMLVWSMDIGDIDHFLQIAQYMDKHNLNPPFETKLPSFISDNARDNIDQLSLEDAIKLADFIEDKDVQENSHAKFLRLLGEKILKEPEITEAQKHQVVRYWSKAVTLDPQIGIKKQLEKLQKELDIEEQDQDNDNEAE